MMSKPRPSVAALNLIEILRVAVIEGGVRASAQDEVEPFRSARRCRRCGAGGTGQLHGGEADAAAGAVDERVSPVRAWPRLKKSPRRGAVGDAEGRALLEGDAVGEGMDLGRSARGPSFRVRCR